MSFPGAARVPSALRAGSGPIRGRTLCTLLALAVLLVPAWAAPAVGQSEDARLWSLDLSSLNPPYSDAASFTTMAVSLDGRVLAVGLENGGVLFLNATTGRELDAAHTADHGAVSRIRLTEDGRRAALVYEDGYLAVIDRDQQAPLITLNTEPGGVAEEVRRRVAADMTRDGRFLMVTDDQVYLYMAEAENGTLRYRQVGLSGEKVGPFMYVHPRLPFFGALSAEGDVAIYSYSASSLSLVGSQSLDLEADQSIEAFGSSGDGSRFAIALSGGQFRRYMPELGPSGGQLRLDYEDQIIGRPNGVMLSESGLRMVVWSVRETYWTEGRNRNVPDEEAAAADAATVRLRPPSFDQRFLFVDTSDDLLRLLARFVGTDAESRLYNMPEQEFFVVAEESTGPAGPSELDADGRAVYRSAGATLQAYLVTEKQLAPPGLGEDGEGTGAGPGANDEGDALFGLSLSSTTLLLVGGGLLLLVLLAVLVPLLFAARRGGSTETLPPLAPEAPGVLPTLGATNAAAPPSVKAVAPSAPPAAAPPEGLLVLQDVSVHGAVTLHHLSAAWRRPAVVTMRGRAEDLRALVSSLGGDVPVSGTLAVGGASAEETPMLFSRRVQAGLAPPPQPGESADAAYRAFATTHRLPGSLVDRRIDADLAWLGPRRHAPVGSLPALDVWKLRLALALIHRPHVVLVPVGELPKEAGRDPRTDGLVRSVLRGVSRHFEVLVVLLDDGSRPRAPLDAWSDESLRLTPTGFTERTLLKDGRPVSPARRGGGGRGKRAREPAP